MHTTEGQKYRYFHHGSFEGDIDVADKVTGETLIKIPFEDLKMLVAEYVRSERIIRLEEMDEQGEEIERLENASDDEVLGLSSANVRDHRYPPLACGVRKEDEQ
jgi:hypothetical protein